jgi:hypothetical protein
MSQLLVSKKLVLILSLSMISLLDYSLGISSKSLLARDPASKLIAQSSPTSSPRISFKLPSRGAPVNTMAAATRGNDNRPVAILPKTNLGLTASNSPVIFVYVPKNTSSFAQFRFRIADQEKKELYSSILPSTQEEGILMLKLPEKLNLSLGESYKWQFSLVEQNGKESRKFTTEGWIEKVPLDRNLEKAHSGKIESWTAINIFAQEGIWQDTLEKLALLHLDNPEDGQIQREWTELLRSVGITETVAQSKIFPYIIQVE